MLSVFEIKTKSVGFCLLNNFNSSTSEVTIYLLAFLEHRLANTTVTGLQSIRVSHSKQNSIFNVS